MIELRTDTMPKVVCPICSAKQSQLELLVRSTGLIIILSGTDGAPNSTRSELRIDGFGGRSKFGALQRYLNPSIIWVPIGVVAPG